MDQPGDKNPSPPPQTADTRPTTPVELAPTTTTSIAEVADSEPAVASASNSFDSVLNTAPSPDPHLQRLPGIAYVEQQARADHAQTDPPAERPLNVTDALSYLDAVKNRFQDQPDVYSYFLEIMKDFKGQVIDTPGVIKRVSHLFSAHPSLIQGFNTFLPTGYRIECSTDLHDANLITVTTPTGTMTQTTNGGSGNGQSSWSTSANANHDPTATGRSTPLQPSTGPPPASPDYAHQADLPPVTSGGSKTHMEDGPPIEPAVQYVQKIKQRCDADTYKQFLEILSSYHHKPDTMDERAVAAQVSRLFKDAPDLRSDFRIFMPNEHGQLFDDPEEEDIMPSRTRTPIDGGRSSSRKDVSGGTVPQKRKRRDREKDKEKERENQKDAPLKDKSGSASGVKKTKSSSHVIATEVASPSFIPSKYPISPRRHPASNAAPSATSSRAHMHAHVQHHSNTMSTIYASSHAGFSHLAPPSHSASNTHFFDRVRRALDTRETYDEFLKLVNLFTQNMIDCGRLVRESRLFLGEGTELMRQWREILAWDETKERAWEIAESEGLMVGSEASGMLFRRGVLNRPSRAELIMRYGSYRKLPASEVSVTCSGRDEMCRSVLNDEWVSHPTWSSEDSGFVAHKKNAFEEALHRSEEERHEYDFHLDAIQRTIGMLEPINAKIAALAGQEDRAGFKLKPNLGGAGKTVHQRVIKKVYGREAGLDILQLMQDLPVDTIPVVLMRLKQKEEEWKRAQREWNKVWREVDARNYPKSLDHLGITFKAADKKALTAKAFLSQIEAVRDEQMAARASLIDPTFARTRKRHHLEFLVDDKAVLQDGLKLTFGFLDRAQPQITFAERKRIEGFFRSFVPLFFGWDPVSFNASFVVLQGVGKENAESDGGASDDVAGNANVTVDDVEVASVASTSSRRSHKKGAAAAAAAAAAGSGDLRKNLLKSEQAKSAGRKARTAGDGLSPAVSRMASPALTEVDSVVDESAAAAGDNGQWKRPSRRNLFFCNGVLYTLVRLLEVLYSRLALFKRLGAKLSVKRSPNAAADPDMILVGDSGTDLHAAQAEHYYGLMLESCERLFDNEIEIGAFEELMRNMFGVKHAYKIFTIDKLIGVLIKQVQIALPDPKTKDLTEILKRERAIVAPTTQDHVNSRRNAEKVLGPDENLFRIDWVPDSKMMTIQLLGKDDLGFGDSEVLTGRWQAYVDSFVSAGHTEGVSQSRVRRPFLRKNLSSPPPEIVGHCGLEIRVCVRTYRLFFVSGTEDYLYHPRTEEEHLQSRARVASRGTGQAVLEALLGGV